MIVTAATRSGAVWLLKIVNHAFGAIRLEDRLDEFHMERMHLVVVLGLLGGEDQVQSDLVGLLHDRPMAGHHPADMKRLYPRDRFQQPLRSRQQCVRSPGLLLVSPEDDNVRKHRLNRVSLSRLGILGS